MLPQGLHRRRSSGLQATCKAKQVQGVLKELRVALGRRLKGTSRLAARTSRERGIASTGRDPLRGTRCGGERMRWKVWPPCYGVVYDALHEMKRGRSGPRRGLPPGGKDDGEGAEPMRPPMLAGRRS
jgi:hypothetical protein